MEITAVEPLDKRRSKIFLEEKIAFVLYRGELRTYQIEEGGELSEENYKQIVEKVLIKRAKERALYLLKDRDRTEKEIKKKLTEGYYPEDVIDRTIAFLKEYHFLDDLDYGRRYILTYKEKRSKKRIQFDLCQKGLEPEQISMLLTEEEILEDGQIEAFLRKKGYRQEEAAPKEKGRLAAALARKGFSFEAIYRVMGEPLA